MALTTCPDCGKEISTSALTCPSCGRPYFAPKNKKLKEPKKKRGCLKIVAWGFVILVFFGIIGSFLEDKQSTPSAPITVAESKSADIADKPMVEVTPQPTEAMLHTLGLTFKEFQTRFNTAFRDNSRKLLLKETSYNKNAENHSWSGGIGPNIGLILYMNGDAEDVKSLALIYPMKGVDLETGLLASGVIVKVLNKDLSVKECADIIENLKLLPKPYLGDKERVLKDGIEYTAEINLTSGIIMFSAERIQTKTIDLE